MSSALDFLDSGEIDRELARRSTLEFIKYTWTNDSMPFQIGLHTHMVCGALDKAIEDYRKGISTYLMITLPHRHGKSEILSRRFPPRFLGEFPNAEVMVTGFSAELVEGFSRDARGIVKGEEYHELYPDVKLSRSASGVQKWSLDNEKGKTSWIGLDGTLTGKGFNLGLCDDPFKGRAEVESMNNREKRWTTFSQDFLSRAAPVCIVILLATTWHEDDLFGRIRKRMAADPHFPRFKELSFPAKAKDYRGEGEYTGEYLFEERYSKQWYLGQYAALGAYAASGLLDCNPRARDGMLIKCEEGVNYHYVDEKPEGFGIDGRGWDLASTKDEVISSDPDWTVGVKAAIKIDYRELMNEYGIMISAPIYSIYIDDIIRMREEAPIRNMKIQTTAVNDSRTGAIQGIESFSGYKDTYTTMAHTLEGVCQVEKINMKGDKVTKASQHIVTPFSDGNVYVNRNIDSDTLKEFFNTLLAFPSGAHDDDVDALTVAVALLKDCGYSTFGSMV